MMKPEHIQIIAAALRESAEYDLRQLQEEERALVLSGLYGKDNDKNKDFLAFAKRVATGIDDILGACAALEMQDTQNKATGFVVDACDDIREFMEKAGGIAEENRVIRSYFVATKDLDEYEKDSLNYWTGIMGEGNKADVGSNATLFAEQVNKTFTRRALAGLESDAITRTFTNGNKVSIWKEGIFICIGLSIYRRKRPIPYIWKFHPPAHGGGPQHEGKPPFDIEKRTTAGLMKMAREGKLE